MSAARRAAPGAAQPASWSERSSRTVATPSPGEGAGGVQRCRR
jgi:hypothetical protein